MLFSICFQGDLNRSSSYDCVGIKEEMKRVQNLSYFIGVRKVYVVFFIFYELGNDGNG